MCCWCLKDAFKEKENKKRSEGKEVAFENGNMYGYTVYTAISVDDKNLFILLLKRFICLNEMKIIYIFARKLDGIS